MSVVGGEDLVGVESIGEHDVHRIRQADLQVSILCNDLPRCSQVVDVHVRQFIGTARQVVNDLKLLHDSCLIKHQVVDFSDDKWRDDWRLLDPSKDVNYIPVQWVPAGSPRLGIRMCQR